jgi:hypothetical protein
MHSPTLALHQLRQLMQRFGYDVCQECAARYVPCVALTLTVRQKPRRTHHACSLQPGKAGKQHRRTTVVSDTGSAMA